MLACDLKDGNIGHHTVTAEKPKDARQLHASRVTGRKYPYGAVQLTPGALLRIAVRLPGPCACCCCCLRPARQTSSAPRWSLCAWLLPLLLEAGCLKGALQNRRQSWQKEQRQQEQLQQFACTSSSELV
jgi:hypothetical protein